MDRSRGTRREKAAEPAATVQSFAGSILSKHRTGRGRDRHGSASMLHAKPKGEPAGIQQRIHIHVSPPRSAEPKKPVKQEVPVAPRIIERETIKTERQTIVIREVVRIIDNQRAARALAMTAPVQLETTTQHRQYPDAAVHAKQQETGIRRQDHHSGSQPAASSLGSSIHKQLATLISKGQNLEKLRRLLAEGATGNSFRVARREDARQQGVETTAAPVAARKRPLTYAHRERETRNAEAAERRAAEAAKAEQAAERTSGQAARTEQSAKRRAAEAAEAEQAAERTSGQAARTEQSAKRRAAEAAEAEQAAERTSRKAARTEQSAKRRAAEAAEAEQAAERTSRKAARTERSAKRRAAEAAEAEQAAERTSRKAARTEQSAKRRAAEAAEAEQAAERTSRKAARTEQSASSGAAKTASKIADGDALANTTLTNQAGNRAVEESSAQPEPLRARPEPEGTELTAARLAFSALKQRRHSKDFSADRRFPELIGARRRTAVAQDPMASPLAEEKGTILRSPSGRATAIQPGQTQSSSPRSGRVLSESVATPKAASSALPDAFSPSIDRQLTAPITSRRASARMELREPEGSSAMQVPRSQGIKNGMLQRVAARRADRTLFDSTHPVGDKSLHSQPSLLRRGSALIFRNNSTGNNDRFGSGSSSNANVASGKAPLQGERSTANRQLSSQGEGTAASRKPFHNSERGTTSRQPLILGDRNNGSQPISRGERGTAARQSLSADGQGVAGRMAAGANNPLAASNHVKSADVPTPRLSHREVKPGRGSESHQTDGSRLSQDSAPTSGHKGQARPSLTSVVQTAPANVMQLKSSHGHARSRDAAELSAFRPTGLVLRRNLDATLEPLVRQARIAATGSNAQAARAEKAARSQGSRTTERMSSTERITATAARSKLGAATMIGRKRESLPASPNKGSNDTTARLADGIQSITTSRPSVPNVRWTNIAASATTTPSIRALPIEGVSRPTAVVQRQRTSAPKTVPVVPLIAKPFAIGAARTSVHEAAKGSTQSSGDPINPANPATAAYGRAPAMLAYGRTPSAGIDANGAAVFRQQSVAADPSPSGSQPIGLTHRTQPAPPAEPSRQVQVEAPRELEPEKLQRMIMKLPQLNPEAIADKVYKALERKMKLEQRRNGY